MVGPLKRRVHGKEPGFHFRSLTNCAGQPKSRELTMILMRENAPGSGGHAHVRRPPAEWGGPSPAPGSNDAGRQPRSAECLRAGKQRFPIR